MEVRQEDVRTEEKTVQEKTTTEAERQMGVPGQQVIVLFLIFKLFLYAGRVGLIMSVNVALSLGVRDVRQDNREQLIQGESKMTSTKDASTITQGLETENRRFRGNNF